MTSVAKRHDFKWLLVIRVMLFKVLNCTAFLANGRDRNVSRPIFGIPLLLVYGIIGAVIFQQILSMFLIVFLVVFSYSIFVFLLVPSLMSQSLRSIFIISSSGLGALLLLVFLVMSSAINYSFVSVLRIITFTLILPVICSSFFWLLERAHKTRPLQTRLTTQSFKKFFVFNPEVSK